MPVRLMKGMVLLTTTRSLMRAAIALICSGLSNITLLGGAENIVSVGLAVWQAWQRSAMMFLTVANETGPSLVGAAGRAVRMSVPAIPAMKRPIAGTSHFACCAIPKRMFM